MAAGAASMAALSTATRFLIGRLQELDDQIDAASNLGVAAGDAQKLGWAFKRLGSDSESAATALSFMTKNIGLARLGSKSAEAAFAKLGLSSKTLAAMEPVEALGLISDRLSLYPTQSERAAAATTIFGKAALSSADALTAGSEAIAHFSKEAEHLGLVLTDLEADKVGKASDAIDKLGAAVKGSGNKLATAWGEPLAALANFTAELVIFEREISPGTTAAEMLGTTLTEAFNMGAVAVKDFERTWKIASKSIALGVESLFADMEHKAKGGGLLGFGNINTKRSLTPLEQELSRELSILAGDFGKDLAVAAGGSPTFGKAKGSLPLSMGSSSMMSDFHSMMKGAIKDGLDGSIFDSPALPTDFTPVEPEPMSLDDFDLGKIVSASIATPETPDALIRGSAAAMSAINRAKDSPMQAALNKQTELLKRLLEVERDSLDALESDGSLELVLP